MARDLPRRRKGIAWGLLWVGLATWAAYASKHEWVPLLFLWGVGLAVVAPVWEFCMLRTLAGALITRTAGERRDRIVAWRRNVWRRCADLPLYGIGAGILAAGTGEWWTIGAMTAVWIVFFVITPVIVFTRKLRRFQDEEQPVPST